MAPDVAIFHYHRGVGLKLMGKFDEAKTVLTEARDKVGTNASLKAQIERELASL